MGLCEVFEEWSRLLKGEKMSKIAWTEKTWNPIAGCTKVSAGCLNCYAEKMVYRQVCMGAARHEKNPDSNEDAWIAYSGVMDEDTHKWNGNIELRYNQLEIPLHWRQPRMIFVNSMSDTFHPKVPDKFIWDIYRHIHMTKQHTYQILTKRIKRALQWYLTHPYCQTDEFKHVWLGTTCENQEWYNKRGDILEQIPAAISFFSMEPLLSNIQMFDTAKWIPDWVIIGAESIGGHPGRECRIEWVRNIVRQCKAAGVAVFVKQIHMWQVKTPEGMNDLFETDDIAWKACGYYDRLRKKNHHYKPKRVLVKDITKFPRDLQAREYPKGK